MRKILHPTQHRIQYHIRSRLRREGTESEVLVPPPDETAVASARPSLYTPAVPESAALLVDLERPALDGAGSLPPPNPTPERRAGILKLNYTHEDCIDAILANPAITQTELALRYGYTQSWISLIINSDAFQAALAKRRDEIISPELKATVEERLRTLMVESSRVLMTHLQSKTCPPNLALGALGVASKALGYGAREQTLNINTSFVVALPAASKDSKEWVEGRTIEHSPTAVGGSASSPEPTRSP